MYSLRLIVLEQSNDSETWITFFTFLARNSIYVIAIPSVRLSHGWVSQKWLKLKIMQFSA